MDPAISHTSGQHVRGRTLTELCNLCLQQQHFACAASKIHMAPRAPLTDEQPHGPFNIIELVQLYQQELVTLDTKCHVCRSSGDAEEAVSESTLLVAPDTTRSLASSSRIAEKAAPQRTLRNILPSLRLVVTTSKLLHNVTEAVAKDGYEHPFAVKDVRVADVSMPFGSIVTLMLKWAFAVIPASMVIGIVVFIVIATFWHR